MGWTYTHKPKGLGISEFFITHGVLSWSDDNPHRYTVLDSAVVGLKTYYAAVEQVHKETGARRVWAAVILLNYAPSDHYNFGWKDMDESMGPCEDDCPERILKLLTETEHEYAKDWRARCWKKINARKARPKIEPGCEIDYFGRTYKVLSSLGRRGFKIQDTGDSAIYRLNNAQARRVTTVRQPAAA